MHRRWREKLLAPFELHQRKCWSTLVHAARLYVSSSELLKSHFSGVNVARAKQSRNYSVSVVALAALFALLTGILFSAMARIDAAQSTREMYRQLGQLQQAQNELLAEQSRLLLERSTLSSLPAVEQTAREDLQMHFPDSFAEVNP